MPAFLKRRVVKVEVAQRSTTRRREWALTLECGHIVYRRTGPAPKSYAANCVACCQPTPERAMAPGDVFQTANGNLYLVLPDLRQAYLGNANFAQSDTTHFEPPRPHAAWKVIARLPNIWKKA